MSEIGIRDSPNARGRPEGRPRCTLSLPTPPHRIRKLNRRRVDVCSGWHNAVVASWPCGLDIFLMLHYPMAVQIGRPSRARPPCGRFVLYRPHRPMAMRPGRPPPSALPCCQAGDPPSAGPTTAWPFVPDVLPSRLGPRAMRAGRPPLALPARRGRRCRQGSARRSGRPLRRPRLRRRAARRGRRGAWPPCR